MAQRGADGVEAVRPGTAVRDAGRRSVSRGTLLRALGYLCNRTWINLVFFSVVLFQRYDEAGAALAAGETYRTSIVMLATSLVACALLHTQVLRLMQHPALDYVGPTLSAAGIAVLLPDLLAGAALEPAVVWGSAVLTGFGSGLTLLNVGRSFVGVGVGTCIATVLWATLGCTILTFAVGFLPLVAAVAVVVALPFLAIACLHGIGPQVRGEGEARWSLGERISGRMVVKFAMCAAVLGIVTGLMRDLYAASDYGTYDRAFQVASLVASCVVVALLLVIITCGGKATIETLYKLTVVLATAGFAVVPLMGDNITVPYVVVSTGYSLFEMLVWVILSDIASRFQYTSVQVFGFGRALILLVGVIAGMAVAGLLGGLGESATTLAATSAVSIICICFLRTYVLTSSDLERFERGMTEGVAEGPGMRAEVGDAAEGSKAAGDDVAGTTWALPIPASAPNAASKPRKVPFQRKCAIIGEFYGLTRRETDVFRLLAAGRNSTRIQEELAISAGTVNTHCYHVFQKLGVHQQQEVIDLLEQADLDAIQAELARRRADR